MLTQYTPFNYTPISFDASSAVGRFSSSASSMALTVVIFILVLFFIGFFFIFARRFFAGIHSTASMTVHRRPPLLLSTNQVYRRYPPPNHQTVGLDPVTLRALPVLTYSGGAKEVVGCVVCLGEFEEEERVKVIPGCGHVFHPGCIDGWLVLHGSCPVCRCSDMLGAGAGVGNCGEIWLDLGGDGSLEESVEEAEEEGKKLVGLGRSKSFRSCKDEGEAKVFLRRSCSV